MGIALGQRPGANLRPYILPIHKNAVYYVLLLCANYLNGRQLFGFQTFGWSDRLIHHALIRQFKCAQSIRKKIEIRSRIVCSEK